MNDLSFNTKALHTPLPRTDAFGALRMPVYDAAAFEYADSEGLEAAFNGTKPGHVYSRSTNPTVEYFERVMLNLTGGLGVVALSSGMAAISNTILTIASAGDNIIASKHVFGNTFSLFDRTLKPFGIEFRFVDLTNLESIKQKIDKNTKAIFLETITNPQLEVVYFKVIAEIAHSNNIVFIADTTLTPPYIFNSKEHGIDIEILSSTKFISGGGTSVGGLVIDNGIYKWQNLNKLQPDFAKFGTLAFIARFRKEVYRNLGACLSPHNAYLQTLGLETFTLRIDKACANTFKLAQWLVSNPKIKNVNYPGLKTSPFNHLAIKQFRYPGSILTFDLESQQQCFKFMNNLKIIRRATNMNDNKTLIIHPWSTIFVEYDEKTRRELNVTDTMMRLSVGIEDCNDLKNDIELALK